MSSPVDLYDTAYAESAERVYREVREQTYGIDLGQTGWMTAVELESFGRMLELTSSSKVLELGCGAGGCAVYLAQTTGADITGVDVNPSGIRNGEELARSQGMSERVRFRCIDASKPLPFESGSLDAVFSNDALCHIPNRLGLLREWQRLLRPGGRMLFTDAMIVTGMLSNEEIAARSCIGTYFFLPPGVNERLIGQAGFEMLEALDTTEAAAVISLKWHNARATARQELVRFEGEANYEGLQRFLQCVHTVSRERRLSRFLYLATSDSSTALMQPLPR